MKKSKKWMAIVAAGLAVLALTAVALPVAAAGNATDIVAHRGGPGGLGDPDSGAGLAEALGITVEELQAAEQAASEAAIQQAVDEGLITQAQADALLERSGDFGGRGFRLPLTGDVIDHDALLAAELGISVDELQAARDAARDAALQQAVADGQITQEQADMMQARQALKVYLDEQGLEESLRSVYSDAVQGAVEAGVITQEQADSILSSQGPFDGFGGRGGMRAPRGMDGMRGFPAPNGDAAPSGLLQRGGAGL